jgi:Holliday junction DNA helicase RuvA
MIGRLRGTLLENEAPILLIETGGVAYEVEVPLSTCANLNDIGSEVILHTHLSISENAHQLFGFSQRRDRQLFRNLIKINGVGPKLGLSILSSMTPETFVSCVMSEEVGHLVKIPGVGNKTAERLVIELRDKLADWQGIPGGLPQGTRTGADVAEVHKKSDEVESALLALGYKPQQATQIVAALAETVDFADTATTELIRLALKQQNN